MRLISIEDGIWKQLTMSFKVVSKQIPSSLTKFVIWTDRRYHTLLKNAFLNCLKVTIFGGTGNKEFVLFVFQIRIKVKKNLAGRGKTRGWGSIQHLDF